MEIEDLKRILDNEVYKDTLLSLSKNTGVKVNNFINPAILNIGLKSLNASSLTEGNIYESLITDNSLFSEFSIIRINGFKSIKIEQEYPKGEEPDEDDIDEELEEESLSVISLIGFLIEFYFLKNSNPTGLVNYLKKIKLPKIEKHIKEIETFYNQAKEDKV